MNGSLGPRTRPVLRQSTRLAAHAAACAAAALAPSLAAGQRATALATVGGPVEERARVRQLLGDTSATGFLLRTPRLLAPAPGTGLAGLALVLPEAVLGANSSLPALGNDGALWAGRGVSALVRGGAAARFGRLTLVLVPEVAYAQNRTFQTIRSGLSGQAPATGPYQAPWFTGPYSIDLPLRFGDRPYTTIGFGQSALTFDAGLLAAGLSTEDQWWGPGARNALVLSNAAEGFPHLFVRTGRPIGTSLGGFEARAIIGAPVQSLYFLSPQAGDETGRALSGAVVTFRPALARGLTVGVERLVLTQASGVGAILGHAFDVLHRNANLGDGDSLRTPNSSDQITGAFARYVLPSAGAEVYGEFTREELPRSLRDALLTPLNTGAYTLGVAHASRLPRAAQLAVRLEVTNLEQTRNYSDRPPPPDYYTGRAAPAGFTNRGQPLGAAIGPGSQSQFVGVDYYEPRWQFGAFVQRVRNQNDALSRVDVVRLFAHDVTIGGGLRGGVRLPGFDARAELTANNRLNYLFQNGRANYFGLGTVDVSNVGLLLTLSPRLPHVSP